jgi:hypothetical protein
VPGRCHGHESSFQVRLSAALPLGGAAGRAGLRRHPPPGRCRRPGPAGRRRPGGRQPSGTVPVGRAGRRAGPPASRGGGGRRRRTLNRVRVGTWLSWNRRHRLAAAIIDAAAARPGRASESRAVRPQGLPVQPGLPVSHRLSGNRASESDIASCGMAASGRPRLIGPSRTRSRRSGTQARRSRRLQVSGLGGLPVPVTRPLSLSLRLGAAGTRTLSGGWATP